MVVDSLPGAFRYTTAGGGAAVLGRATEIKSLALFVISRQWRQCQGQKLSIASSKDGWPKSPILKVGFDPAELSPWPLIWDENRPATATSLDFFDEAQPILWQGLSQSSIGDR